MNTYLALAAAKGGFHWTSGETVVVIAVILIFAGVTLGKRMGNAGLALLAEAVLVFAGTLLIISAFPYKILGAIWKISSHKLGIPA